MPSINLLPENFTIEAYKKKERIAVYVLATFFLAASVAAYAKTEVDARQEKSRATTLDASVNKVEADIQKSVEDSDLLSAKYNKTDIEKLLGGHIYFSRALAFLKGTIVNGVYVSSAKISAKEDGDFSLEAGVYAKDYDTLLNQFSVLMNSLWVKSADMGGVKYDDEKGISCTASMVLRKDYFMFHDQYWDFGAEALAKNLNKYIKVDNFSVVLKKSADKNGNENAAQSVVVSFDGKSYDQEKLTEFEKKLKETDNITKVEINKSSSKDNKPGVESFQGSITLKY